MRNSKKVFSFILAIIIVVTAASSGATFVNAADGDPVLTMSVANKIDVALAVGPTSVDYSTFEADLRKALKYEADGVTPREHPVPDEDVYVMATQAVSASTTSEFSWWEYDHTRHYTTRYNSDLLRQVAPIVDHTNHVYVESDTSASQTTSSPGRPQDTNPLLATYTPPASAYNLPTSAADYGRNPDVDLISGSVHPYQGNYRHIIESDNGATMDFYGYGANANKDFRYLPNDQKTIKTFEFSIAEDLAYDALDGVGFFFNLDITGVYGSAQLMSGYLLFLEYTTLGVGNAIKLYKITNLDTKSFHHVTSTDTTRNLVSNFNTSQITLVAQSMVYSSTHFSRRIKIEAGPDKVSVWYVGNTAKNHAATLNTPIDEYQTPVAPINFTIQPGGVLLPGQTNGSIASSVRLDTNLIKSYGFGPMSSYRSHACARPTHLALQNLTMTYDKVKTLTEVVREPEWHENTLKYLVNLNEYTIEDFETNAVIAELLARLTNDDIYYIGWGSTMNAIASAAFLRKHSLKGTIVDIESVDSLIETPEWAALDAATQASYLECIQEALTYKAQIQSIADEIYKRYWNQADENRVLTTDTVQMSVSGADMQNTADAQWPNGKWMIEHFIDEESITVGQDDIYMTNFEGQYAYSGQYMPDLESSYTFTQPGLYKIYYRNTQVGELIVHRSPVADFIVTCDGSGNTTVVDTSYDPDVYAPAGINGSERGIKSANYSWLDLSDPTMLEPMPGIPDQLIEGHDYQITLTVVDDWGAINSISKLITYTTSSLVTLPPFAEFTLTPTLFMKTSDLEAQAAQTITLNNRSYDPAGLPITSTWEIFKDESPYAGLVISDSDFTANSATISIGQLPAGKYKVVLTVNNGTLDSASVAKFFEIVEDIIPPTASISQSAPRTFTGNTNLTLTFSDTGGSGYKEARFVVTQSATAPANTSSDWRPTLPSVTRNALVSAVGANYVHWEAWDNAGNYKSGVFGPYTMEKKDITMLLGADPENGTKVVYDSTGNGITLTASLQKLDAEDADPTGTIYFYQDGSLMGSGTINSATGIATWTGNPLLWGGGSEFSASYLGDSNYHTASATTTCNVDINPDATITLSALDMDYTGDPYDQATIAVNPTISYKVEYEGRDDTTYTLSTTPPTDVGKYTIIVTTTQSGYEVKTESADFEICKIDQDPLIVTGLDSIYELEVGQTVALGTSGGSTDEAVTYVSSDPEVASISGNILTIHKVGEFEVTATMAGNSTYNDVSSLPFEVEVEDTTAPTASISQNAPQTFSVNTTLTLTFFDNLGTGYKEARFAVTQSSTAPVNTSSDWSSTLSTDTRSAFVSAVGENYVHWEAWDNAGNYASGTFGPYTMEQKNIDMLLDANPENGTEVIYNSTGNGIILTASLQKLDTEDADPTGTVDFYQDGNYLGSGTVDPATGIATWTGNPLVWGDDLEFSAQYQGDSNFNTASATTTCNVSINPDATINLSALDMDYTGNPYDKATVATNPTISYKVEYVGRDDTTYTISTTPPTDIGKYTVIVTTTQSGYEVKSESADFEICKIDQDPLYVTGLNSIYEIKVGQTVTLGTSGGTTGGAVTYVSSNPEVASISGNVLTIHKVGDFEVTATMAGDSIYNDVSSLPFEVEVEDTTAPTGKIEIKSNGWTSFWNTVTFELFFKNTTDVTVTANDNSGENVTIEYYLSSAELDFTADDWENLNWRAYTTLSINPNNKYIVYVRLTDNYNNVSIINSTGVVVYTDSEPANAITYIKLSGTDKNTSVVLNNNAISKVMNGAETLVLGTDYTVSGGTITLLKSYLEGLDEGEYILTVYYDPLGENYVDDVDNDAPETTEIVLTIKPPRRNSVPKTEDNRSLSLWLVCSAVSLLILVYGTKKNYGIQKKK